MNPCHPIMTAPDQPVAHGAVLAQLDGSTTQAIATLAATVRNQGVLAPELQAVAALATARWWGCEFSLALQVRLAEGAGVSGAAIDQITSGAEPHFGEPAADMVWELATQVLVAGTIRTTLLQRASHHLNKAEIMEVIAAVGCHSLTSMLHNGARRLAEPPMSSATLAADSGLGAEPPGQESVTPNFVEP